MGHSERHDDVTWRRKLLWIGIVCGACWIAWWTWHYATTCSLIGMSGSRAITCRWESTTAGGMTVVSQTAPALRVLWDMAARAIGIPACVFVAGAAACWVVERLRNPAR